MSSLLCLTVAYNVEECVFIAFLPPRPVPSASQCQFTTFLYSCAFTPGFSSFLGLSRVDFIFPSDEGSLVWQLDFIVSAGFPSSFFVFQSAITFCGSAMVGHLKNVSSIFAQTPDRRTNIELTTISPTIANTMLAVVFIR